MVAMGNRRLLTMVVVLIVTSSAQVASATKCDNLKVAFRAGQLTISSQGCSLQDILVAVGHETGITVEQPDSTASEPVWGDYGPGSPARIIETLLDGSPFNLSLGLKDGTKDVTSISVSERVIVASTAQPPATDSGSRAKQAAIVAQADPPAGDTNEFDSSQTKPKPELKDSMLQQLPALPSGIPSSMWSLYPDLAGAVISNGGTLPALSALGSDSASPVLQPRASAGTNNLQSSQPSPAPEVDCSYYPLNCVRKGAIGLPTLPPGIDPRIANLYPWNLMQLIQAAMGKAGAGGN